MLSGTLLPANDLLHINQSPARNTTTNLNSDCTPPAKSSPCLGQVWSYVVAYCTQSCFCSKNKEKFHRVEAYWPPVRVTSRNGIWSFRSMAQASTPWAKGVNESSRRQLYPLWASQWLETWHVARSLPIYLLDRKRILGIRIWESYSPVQRAMGFSYLLYYSWALAFEHQFW